MKFKKNCWECNYDKHNISTKAIFPTLVTLILSDFDVHFGEHMVTHWHFLEISGEIFINFTIYVNTFVNFEHSQKR